MNGRVDGKAATRELVSQNMTWRIKLKPGRIVRKIAAIVYSMERKDKSDTWTQIPRRPFRQSGLLVGFHAVQHISEMFDADAMPKGSASFDM
jgi:hypothetical protein